MPRFDRLADEQVAALVEYVKYLSIRGETELFLRQMVVDEDRYPLDHRDMEELLEDYLAPTLDLWSGALQAVVAPPPPPPDRTPEQRAASISLGRGLYAGKNARCIECHGPHGDGHGEQTELYDDWNKLKKGATPEETRDMAGLFRLPIQRLRPRDFTRGIFRGGSRPIDLYWRVHVGIKGTPMPAAGPARGSAGVLTEKEIWHVVNYVRSLAE
jgi:mono/diheme cytochrome c family protein